MIYTSGDFNWLKNLSAGKNTMHKMSSEAERLTQKRKITVEKYSESKIYTICVTKRGANDLYVTWVKMRDLQKTYIFEIYVI